MRESNDKVVAGGTSGGMHFMLHTKHGYGKYYDPTARREGIRLLPRSSEGASPREAQ